jgi:hypothetical protein
MDKRRRVYLAGPPGTPATQKLQDAGLEVITAPPEPEDAREWGPWARYALALLVSADAVAIQPGGGHSRGVSLICQTAHELAIPVRSVRGWLTKAGQDAYMARLTGDRP